MKSWHETYIHMWWKPYDMPIKECNLSLQSFSPLQTIFNNFDADPDFRKVNVSKHFKTWDISGLDPAAPSVEDPTSTLEMERFNLGRKVLAANHAPLSQEFLKKG